MKFNWKKSSAAAALLAMAITGRAKGAAFVDVSILGSTDQVSYSNSVSATAGQTVYYEIEVEMAPLGSINGTHTITSLVVGTDGVTGLSYNLSDNGVTWNTDNTLAGGNTWTNTGSSAGTVTANSGVASVTGALTPGAVAGVSATNTPGNVLVQTGSFVAGASSSSVTGTYDGTTEALKIDGNAFHPNVTSGDPNGYYSFAPLAVNVTSTPEPGSLALLALTGAGLLARRRRLA